MDVTELAAITGLSTAAIKFYVREGLLNAPVRLSANRSAYNASHVGRIKLIRTLTELGKLSLAKARTVIAAVDDPTLSVHSVLGVAQRAVSETSVDAILAQADELGYASLRAVVHRYRDAAAQLAVVDLEWVHDGIEDRTEYVERAVVGTILGDALFTAARREAQTSESGRRSRHQSRASIAARPS